MSKKLTFLDPTWRAPWVPSRPIVDQMEGPEGG